VRPGWRLGLIIGAATLALGLTVVAFVAAWNNAGDTELSVHGWIAMALGFGVTGLLGGGLMWLAFYSSRKGWDDIDRDP
jgi:protein-S-isoprenylcysteine O-methyltransferase Ste14